jgi:hypothetical protein
MRNRLMPTFACWLPGTIFALRHARLGGCLRHLVSTFVGSHPREVRPDLPLVFHPIATGARWSVVRVFDVKAIILLAEVFTRPAGRAIAMFKAPEKSSRENLQ